MIIRFFRMLALGSFGLTLAACGGGGSGSVGSVSLDRTALSFAADENGSAPASQIVHMHIGSGASYVGAAWPSGSQPNWANVQVTPGVDASDWVFTVSITNTNLAAGTYTATLELGTADASQHILSSENVALTYTVSNVLAFTSPTMSVSIPYGSTPSSYLTFNVSGTIGKQWQVTTTASWLTVPSGVQAAGATSFNASVDTASLPIGNTQGTVTITNAANPAESASITVILDVTAPTQPVGFTGTAPSVSSVFGNPVSQSLQVNLSGVTYKRWMVSSNASWVTVPSSVQGPGIASFNATVDTTGLPVGTSTATLTLTDADYSADTATLTVTANVAAPTLTVSAASILLGGSNGLSSAAQPLSFSINTGTNSYAWTATLTTHDGASWLKSSAVNGNVSATQQSLNLSYDRTGIKGGTYTGNVLLSVDVLGQTYQANVPVTFNLEADRLLVSADGVAFSKFPSSGLLTRTLTVASTIGLTTVPWAAVSDQSWLTATASGTTGGNLILTASPTGLTVGAEYTANVTITSTDPTIENTQTVRVGFYVGSVDPTAVSATLVSGVAHIVTSPVEPYAFVNTEGTAVSVYNVYTGALVTTYSSVAPKLGAMTVSSDGSTLYVVDLTNYRIVPVAVSTGTVGSPYQFSGSVQDTWGIAYGRPDAHPVLFAATGAIFDVSAQAQYAATLKTSTSGGATRMNIVAGAEGSEVYLQDDLSSSTLYLYDVAYSALGGGGLTATYVAATFSDNQSNCTDLAAVPDGSAVFSACGSAGGFLKFNGTTLAFVKWFQGSAYPNNVAVAWNGDVVGGIDSIPTLSSVDLWTYDTNGNALGSLNVPPANSTIEADTVRISGDGTRVTAVTNGTQLNFITVP